MDVTCADVVWVRLVDPHGENEKLRPAVVVDVTPNGEVCIVVAGTTKFSESDLSSDVIRLPYAASRDQRCRTGLKEKTAVICTWFERVRTDEIEERAGSVPVVLYNAILHRVKMAYIEKKKRGGA